MPTPSQPAPFLEIRVHDLGTTPPFDGLCAGFEAGQWRAEQLARHTIDWLPEFALTPAEWGTVNHSTAVEMLRRAARTVYTTQKFKKRGEFGELLLHIAVRQIYDSLPVISKLYYKTATNETVKGFDAVHVVGPPDAMELWLGEAKFYTDIRAAIRDVIGDLQRHSQIAWLRDEFMLITNKVDDTWPHAPRLRRLMHPNTTLDEIFTKACVPVFLTYESPCIATHDRADPTYCASLEAEFQAHRATFSSMLASATLPSALKVHLFLLPMHSKKTLVKHLDARLRALQQL